MSHLVEQLPALTALLDYRQADQDGTTVVTSREAIHEVEDHIAELEAALAKVTAERDGARVALRRLIKYGQWQIDEGPGHHPTLPSAISAAVTALTDGEDTHGP